MAGYPVTIRLLDPPLHEFLPSLDDLLVETTELRFTEGVDSARFRARDALLTRVRQLHEENPMLGLRVCRLGIVYPEIYAMQVRAIFEAACGLRRERRRRSPRCDDTRRRDARRDAVYGRRRAQPSPTRSSRVKACLSRTISER